MGEKKPKEGDLYKTITTFGKTFELYYGYYEEKDRHSKYNFLVEIYPDFIINPIYTDDGLPFVTAMQEPCEHYKKIKNTTNKCVDCKYFQPGEELFGLCKSNKNALKIHISDKKGGLKK